MATRRARPGAALLWCALLALVASCGDEASIHHVVRTESGGSWKVVSSQLFTTSDGVEALRIKYETDLDLAEWDALRREVLTFFADIHTRFAGANVTIGVVTAASPIRAGWAMERDTVTFRLERQADGTFAVSRGPRSD